MTTISAKPRSSSRHHLFTFTEAERYERLVPMEGSRVFVQFGRLSAEFKQVTGELVGVAYPMDSKRPDPASELIIRDEEGCWRTVKSSTVRTIEVING